MLFSFIHCRARGQRTFCLLSPCRCAWVSFVDVLPQLGPSATLCSPGTGTAPGTYLQGVGLWVRALKVTPLGGPGLGSSVRSCPTGSCVCTLPGRPALCPQEALRCGFGVGQARGDAVLAPAPGKTCPSVRSPVPHPMPGGLWTKWPRRQGPSSAPSAGLPARPPRRLCRGPATVGSAARLLPCFSL